VRWLPTASAPSSRPRDPSPPSFSKSARREPGEEIHHDDSSLQYFEASNQAGLVAAPPDPVAEIFASWVRVIEFAPIENKPALFGMMARDAAAWANSLRQQAIDDMWLVAGEVDLVDLIGAASVRVAIAFAFDWGAR
jgi:hypothetical protein